MASRLALTRRSATDSTNLLRASRREGHRKWPYLTCGSLSAAPSPLLLTSAQSGCFCRSALSRRLKKLIQACVYIPCFFGAGRRGAVDLAKQNGVQARFPELLKSALYLIVL